MGRILLQALEEVLGREGVQSILEVASHPALSDPHAQPVLDKKFSFGAVSRLIQSLEEAYGPQGGRGTALRVGRACFQYGLRAYGLQLGVTGTAYRLLPLRTKLRVGAHSFADLFNRQTDQRVRVEEAEDKLLWQIERCPLCWERQTREPVCHLAVGLLQESLTWLSAGRLFNVEEIACIARGDRCCSIQIDPTPIS